MDKVTGLSENEKAILTVLVKEVLPELTETEKLMLRAHVSGMAYIAGSRTEKTEK